MDAPVPRRSWKVLASPRLVIGLGTLALCLFALIYGLIGPTLPLMGADFAVGLARQGALMTFYALGYLLAVLLGGYLADRWGKERVLTLGLAVAGAGLFAIYTARLYLGGSIGMAIVGAGGGLIEMVVSAIVSDRMPHRRGPALNLLQLAFGLSAVSPLILTWAIGAARSWRPVFAGLGAAALALAPVTALLKPLAGTSGERIDRRALALLVRRRRLWAVAASQFAYIVSEVGLVSWIVSYLVSERATPPAQANGAVSLFFVTMLAGRMASTGLSTRVPLHRLLVGSSVLAAVLLGVVLMAPMGSRAWVGVGILGLGYAGIFGTIIAYAGESYPQYSGTVFGLVMAAGGAGAVVGPWLIGVLADATSIGAGLGLAVVAMLAAAVIFLALGHSRRDL